LKRQIDELHIEIRDWVRGDSLLPDNAFDWSVEFAEVFEDGGFDIVVANTIASVLW
jgi:hypothetical protein